MHRVLTFILTVFLAPFATGQDPFGDPDFLVKETTAAIVPEATQVEPADYFRVAFTLDLQPHYHAFYKNAGIIGDPPSVKWELPEGFRASELMFPLPSAIKSSSTGTEAISYGYEGKVTFIAQVDASADLERGKEFTIKGTFEWQECDATCIQGSKDFSFAITVGEETVFVEEREAFFEEAAAKLPEDASTWGAIATEKKNVISLKVLHPEGLAVKEPIYFFSDDKQIDSQAAQEVSKIENGFVLTLARNEGNEELFIDAGEVLDSLTGLLTFQTEYGPGSIPISTELSPDAEISGGAAEVSAFIAATEKDRKAGLEVYDPEARPDYVLLGGAEEKKVTFWTALPLVFLGGLILNLMPCVFPVLGLKVMGFVAQAGEDEGKIKIHGLVFGLGLLVTMWILSSIIISLELDWGQQLSNPVFLGFIIILLFVMGLNLYGLFEIGTSMTSVGGELQAKKGYSGSFFSGVLTTLIATPCSGPFLGAVMTFALSQDKLTAFFIFTVFGLGIAFPYVLLSFFPKLIKKLPRPGAWMESFKQIMSFLVFATVIFFLRSYLKLVGEEHFNYFLFALTLIALGCYIYGRWGTIMTAKTKRMVTGYGLAGIFLLGGLTWAYNTAKPPKPGLAWNEWYPGIVELSRPKKRIIWVDYTADW